jgi:hypothetical protein
MVVDTMGNNVKIQIMLRRSVFEVNFAKDARYPSFCLRIMSCRWTSQRMSMPKRNIKGANVAASNRSWKLVSMIQLIGMTDRSKLNTLKCPQNARNVDGSFMGYSVATFERIWVNVIRILYLVCASSKNVSILEIMELAFPGRLVPFPL